jgi:hypothetical protein
MLIKYYFSLFGKYLMKIFRIAFASFLAAASLNAIAHPSMAKHKNSSYSPATTEHPAEKSYDDTSYEEEAPEAYEKDTKPDWYGDDSSDHDVPDVKDDNSPDEYTHTKKGRKYKSDMNDHPNHTDKNSCVESAVDEHGGKTGWHTDAYDPTHYDDKDDVAHCGYYFPHETGNSTPDNGTMSKEDCDKETGGKYKGTNKYHKGHKH